MNVVKEMRDARRAASEVRRKTNVLQKSAFPMGMSGHFRNALGERFAREQAKPREGAARRSFAGERDGCFE